MYAFSAILIVVAIATGVILAVTTTVQAGVIVGTIGIAAGLILAILRARYISTNYIRLPLG